MSGPLFAFRPARCERPPFGIGDRFEFPRNEGRYVVRESCTALTILDHAEHPGDNAHAIERITPRLWESVWGRTVRWQAAGRAQHGE